ncbi:MAG: FtsX-like permease family protein, partial [Bryobacteraceae bacterium]
HVLSMRISATGVKYRQDEAVVQFYREIADRVTHLPGVKAEGTVSALPLTGTVGWGEINVEGYHPAPGQELQVDFRIASADYFRTMEIPLVLGRFFSVHDTGGVQKAAIIDQKFAQRFWPQGDAVGKHLWFDHHDKPFTIVGVVQVVKQYGLDNEGNIAVYFPDGQQVSNNMYLVARTSSEAAAVAGSVVREIHAVDPNVPVFEIRTMQERLHDSLARQRFATTMLGAFAAFALLLATVGVYGVLSYLVSQSRRDIGIRIALGAQPADIVGMVVRHGMELAGIGIAAGLIGAAALTRVMAGLLYGVTATDAVTFSAVAVILGAAAFAATAIPAQRATRVDPITVLREE